MGRVTLEKLAEAPRSGRLSYEDFLATDFDNPHVEWVDGKVVQMPPIGDAHQDIGVLLLAVVKTFVEEKNLGVVRYEPFQMKTGVNLPGRSPDIFFVSTAHKKRLKKTFLAGPADMVVEIISPESRGRDRGEKFYEYEEGGVPEYWLIDPERQQAEFYLRDKGGIFRPAPLDAAGVFHSRAINGFWIDPKWFWKSPLPSVLSVLKQLELI